MDVSARRQVAIAAVAAAAVLGLLGFVFWHTLPPVGGNVVVAQHAGAPPFVPPVDIPAVMPEVTAAGVSFALLADPENQQRNAPGYYEAELRTWRERLRSVGAVEATAAQAEVLVIPWAECFGAENRRLLQDHLAAGRGVILSGVLGAYDGICMPTGDTIITSLLGGGSVIAPLGVDSGSVYGIQIGGGVLGAGIPPGARLTMAPGRQVAFRARSRELYYADYDRRPVTVAGEEFFDGAIVRARVDGGRVVAIGFPLQTLDGNWSSHIMDAIIANAARWAAGRVIYQLAAWPNGQRAAAVIAQDVEADYHNARNTAALFAGYDIPSTAFIVGRLGEADRATTDMLARYREIATHTYSHLPLDTMSPAGQARELARSKRVTEALSGRPVLGLRPPEERFNMQTLQVWADLGGEYIFTTADMRVAAPEIIPLLPDSLIMLSRVSADDFELLSRSGMRDIGDITRRLTRGVDHAVSVGGLYMFSYHSHMFAQKPLLPVLRALAEHIDARPSLWATTADSVASWWRARSRIRLEDAGDALLARNLGDRALDRAVIIIDRPDGSRSTVTLPPLQPNGPVRVGADGSVTVHAPVRAAGSRQ